MYIRDYCNLKDISPSPDVAYLMQTSSIAIDGGNKPTHLICKINIKNTINLCNVYIPYQNDVAIALLSALTLDPLHIIPVTFDDLLLWNYKYSDGTKLVEGYKGTATAIHIVKEEKS